MLKVNVDLGLYNLDLLLVFFNNFLPFHNNFDIIVLTRVDLKILIKYAKFELTIS